MFINAEVVENHLQALQATQYHLNNFLNNPMPKHQLIKQLPSKPMYFGETEQEKPREVAPNPKSIKWSIYLDELKQWQDSITWHKIEEEDEAAFRKLAHGCFFKNKHVREIFEVSDVLNKALAEGISIPDGLVGLNKEIVLDKILNIYPYIIKQKESEAKLDKLREGRTNKAVESCTKWLSYCIEIGWDKSQLDALETIWWEHRDNNGNLLIKKR
nr:hypothetical protein [uncultured Flavobacterium sp.]